jgi:hypothetical protein
MSDVKGLIIRPAIGVENPPIKFQTDRLPAMCRMRSTAARIAGCYPGGRICEACGKEAQSNEALAAPDPDNADPLCKKSSVLNL